MLITLKLNHFLIERGKIENVSKLSVTRQLYLTSVGILPIDSYFSGNIIDSNY
jgi:hypothetical protein